MSTWWLEAGEDGSDRLNLNDGTTYTVLAGEFTIDDDGEDPERYQIVSVPLMIRGTSKNALFNARRAILTKLNQASGGMQPGSGLPAVNIAIRFGNADTLVRWFATEGTLDRGSIQAITGNTLGTMSEPAMLRLRCYRGGLGEAIEYGPFD